MKNKVLLVIMLLSFLTVFSQRKNRTKAATSKVNLNTTVSKNQDKIKTRVVKPSENSAINFIHLKFVGPQYFHPKYKEVYTYYDYKRDVTPLKIETIKYSPVEPNLLKKDGKESKIIITGTTKYKDSNKNLPEKKVKLTWKFNDIKRYLAVVELLENRDSGALLLANYKGYSGSVMLYPLGFPKK